ncbi:MAG TPA: GatB/YqeY domain-containing protein, partial [Patescibacteria group bacterium]|nr:GatB/YqeY domain-containing protein [Patescibacteria group bacterium]
QIESDFLTAYKAGETAKVSILRMVKSAIKNAEISAKSELADPEIIKILRREVKQRQESIVEFEKGHRNDLVASNQDEIEIINAYLPAQISTENIEKVVDGVIAELNATASADFGKVIGAVMKKINGDADGSLVASIIKTKLTQK